RSKYLQFFKDRAHAVVPSAPLVPENDPSVLFTTAGMHPLVPYLLGRPHPSGKRLVNCQKCVRTTDIEEVGDASHLTFFEMLGNWSLGIPEERIVFLPAEHNWWAAGEEGPCGPDTEIFVDITQEPCERGSECIP